jgi:hypothetical protein
MGISIRLKSLDGNLRGLIRSPPACDNRDIKRGRRLFSPRHMELKVMLLSVDQKCLILPCLEPLKRVVEIAKRPFCPQNADALIAALDQLVVAHVAASLESRRSRLAQ